MAIDPRLTQLNPLSSGAGIADRMGDLQRRLAKLEAVRTSIGDTAIVGSMVETGAITTSHIEAGSITADLIQALAINAGHINANSIATNHLQANAVTADKIAANVITAGHIAAGTITAGQIAAGTITATQIAANTITANEIAANAITASEIAANVITAGHIASGTITATQITSGTITAAQIASGTITATQIAADTITGAQIAALTITAGELAANSVTAAKILAGEITATHIASGTITATNIAANTITAGQIAADAITASEIAADAVTAVKINVANLAAISNDMGNISAGTITGGTIQTAASGSRVVTNSTGIKGYASDGTTINFEFNTGSGLLTAKGVIIAQAGSALPAALITGSLGGGNLLKNSSGEDFPGNWTGFQGTLASETTIFKYGAKSLKITCTTAGLATIYSPPTAAAGVLVEPGKTYTFSVWVRAGTTARQARVTSRFGDAAGTLLASGSPNVWNFVSGPNTNTSNSSWTRLTATGVAPPLAVRTGIVVDFVSAAIGEVFYADGFQIEEADVASAFAPDPAEITPGSIGPTQLADNSVTNAKLADAAVDTAELANLAVNAGKLADLAVTTAKLDNLAVLDTKLAANAVTTAKVADGAILTAKLANLAVDSTKLADLAVLSGKLADNAVTTGKILDDAISAAKLDVEIGGGNVLLNSSAERSDNATTGWNVYSNNIVPPAVLDVVASSGAKHGAKMFRMTNSTDTVGQIGIVTAVAATRARPGESWTASAYTQPSGAARNALVHIRFVAADFVTQTGSATSSYKSSPGNAWTRHVMTGIAPALTAYVHIYIWFDAPESGGLYYFDAIQLEQAEYVTAYAPRPDEILINSITTTEIAPLAITSAELADNAIITAKVADDAITTTEIADNAITAPLIAANAVIAGKINADAVTTATIAAGAVTAAEIAADTITASQIAANAITATELAANAVIAGKIAAGIIVAADIAADTITGAKIAANTVTASEIAANTITAAEIAVGTITANELAANSVTSSEILAGSVIAGKIGALAITAAEIAANTITAAKIAANTITANEIAADAVTASEIAAGAVTASEILANTITANEIAANAITASELAADAVTATKILAGSVTTEKLTVGSIANSAILNGGFEDADAADATLPANWRRNQIWGGGTSIRTTAAKRSGDWGVSLSRDATAIQSSAMLADTVPVNEGEVWYVSCWARGVSGTQTFYLRVRGGATYLAFNQELTLNVEALNISTTWTKYGGQVTIPAGMTWGAPTVLNYYGTGGTVGVAYVDDIEFSKVNVSAQIADGAIIASKIGALQVTAGKIAANSVTATEIAALTITAAEIAAGAITTAKMTANTIDGNVITTNTLTGGKIISNTIDTLQLAAGAVTASTISAGAIESQHISIANTQPVDVKNGMFSAGISGGIPTNWNNESGGAATWTIEADTSFGQVAKAVAGASGNHYRGQTMILPKGRHVFRAWVKTTSVAGTGGARFQLTVHAGTATAVSAPFVTGTTDWTLIEGTVDVPGAPATIRIYLHLGTAATGTAYWANVHTLSSVTTTEIGPGVITTGHITTNTLSGGVIQAGTLDAAKITAGSITATQIGAGSIRTEHLSVSSPTVRDINNGAFTAGMTGSAPTQWTHGAGTWTVEADAAFGQVAKIVNGVSANSYIYQDNTLPKGRHVLRSWMKTTSVSGGSLLLNAVVQSGTATITNALTNGTTDWTLRESLVEVTSATAVIRCYLQLNPGTGTGYFTNVHYVSSISTTEITPGAIITAHITTDSLSGSRIETGSMDATKITAFTITATQLAASSITTDKIGFRFAGTNLAKNSSYEQGITPNIGFQTTVAADAAAARTGSLGALVTCTTAGTAYLINVDPGYMLRPPVGAKITMTAWVKAPSAVRVANIGPRYYTDTTFINESINVQSLPDVVVETATTSTAWQRIRYTFPWTPGSFSVPATATRMGWNIRFSSATVGQVFHIDDLQIEYGDAPSEWSQYIDPTVIDGSTITSPTIKTSPSAGAGGAGIILDTTGFRSYDSAGTLSVGLYADGVTPAVLRGKLEASGGLELPLIADGIIQTPNKLSWVEPAGSEAGYLGMAHTPGLDTYATTVAAMPLLRGHWQLGETSGTSMAKTAGSFTDTLTVSGTHTLSTGGATSILTNINNQGALTLGGGKLTPSGAQAQWNQERFTWAMWVRPTTLTTTWVTLVDTVRTFTSNISNPNSVTWGYRIQISTTGLRLVVYSGINSGVLNSTFTWTQTATLAANNTYFLAVAWQNNGSGEGTQVISRVNAVTVITPHTATTGAGNPASATTWLTGAGGVRDEHAVPAIGSTIAGTEAFAGKIDEVVNSGAQLTGTHMQMLYSAGLATTTTANIQARVSAPGATVRNKMILDSTGYSDFDRASVDCFITGSNTWVGGGADIAITAGSVIHNPWSATTGDHTFIVPTGRGGLYLVWGWVEYQNSATNHNARVSARINGATSSTLAKVSNDTSALYPAASGFEMLSLAAGTSLSLSINHSEGGSRTVAWRFMVQRVT